MEELFLQTICPLLDRVEFGEGHRGAGQGLYRTAPLFHPVGDLVLLSGNGIEQKLVEFFDVHGEFRRCSRGHVSQSSFRRSPPARSCSSRR